jgi:hypothetical protein
MNVKHCNATGEPCKCSCFDLSCCLQADQGSNNATAVTTTKLEQEILKAFTDGQEVFKHYPKDKRDLACAGMASEVAKRYIEKAWIEGYYALADPKGCDEQYKMLERWLKDNGVTK